MLGRTNISGGGGAGLNFKVVGNPQPAEAKENTIWIDTNTTISGWIFSAAQPENPTEGTVWIATGTASAAAFNALKKNGIQVYPVSAKQYVDGAWVKKTAKSYQGGAWVEWIPAGALYWRGNECVDVTGGWSAMEKKMSSDAGTTVQTYEITRNEDNLEFTKTGLIGAIMHTVNPVDLTDATAIHFKGELYPGSTARWAGLYVWNNLSGTYWDSNAAAKVLGTTGTVETELTLDVSALDGAYYIGFGIYHHTSRIKLEELTLEV